MRVRSLHVANWRNLADLRVDVPPEARLVCLVGENGTGKSTLLELLSWSAHQLGMSTQLVARRPIPRPTAGTDFYAEVTIATERVEALRDALRPTVGDMIDNWDGDVILRVQSWAGSEMPQILPGMPYSADPEMGGQASVVLAGGIASDHAANVGAGIVQALRTLPELLHLYIDAERVFPAAEVRDDEIMALSRQDLRLPQWLKQQASQVTQNLYLEWMRSMLGRQQRLQSDYYQAALAAKRSGDDIAAPTDPLSAYRAGVQQVLPHLHFIRLDQESRRLIFDSAGKELPYEELSGGERELAFLIGQLDRFGLRDGLFLLDEPELHLNPELLRGWLDYLRSTIGNGQAWVATHSLEAAEVAGPNATIVIERDNDRVVRRAAALATRPALTTLAAAVGTPAFSLARSRLVFIEGTRERRERDRFATVLDADVADRFIEVGGCDEVIDWVRKVRRLASEEEQLRVAGIVDRDFRTQALSDQLLNDEGIHVLGVHEIENLFLQPSLLEHLLSDLDRHDTALDLLQRAADPDAGRWAFERSRARGEWTDDVRPALQIASAMTWGAIAPDLDGAARQIADGLLGLDGTSEAARRRVAIREAFSAYATARAGATSLSAECFGKQTLNRVAQELSFQGVTAVEARGAVLWRSGEIARPAAARAMRAYLETIPVLRG